MATPIEVFGIPEREIGKFTFKQIRPWRLLFQEYVQPAEDRASDAWQAAFDNVLAGVDEELLDAIHGMVEYMRWDYPDDFYFPGYRDSEYEFAKWENELPF